MKYAKSNGVKPPTKKEYKEAYLETLETWAPRVYPCRVCRWPVIYGYMCNRCECRNPGPGSLDG